MDSYIPTIGERPLLQVRYLTFAQVGLFGMWAVLVATGGTWTRWAVASIILVGAVSGFCDLGQRVSLDEHAAVKAVRFLQTQHRPDDVILVPQAAELNQTLFISKQIGMERPRIMWPRSAFSAVGHTVHIAALRYDEVLWQTWEQPPPPSNRIWLLAAEPGFAVWPPHEFAKSRQWTFTGGENTAMTLQLLERSGKAGGEGS